MQAKEIFSDLLKKAPPDDFKPTGLSKEYYLDIIELSLAGYSEDHIRTMMPPQGEPVDDIQAFSRITLLLGILIANGRKKDKIGLFCEMMDLCVSTFYRKEGDTRNDFSVKEAMLALRTVKGLFPKEQMEKWFSEMAKVDPVKNFVEVRRSEDAPPLHNINIYNMVGEYLRELEGLTDTEAYFDRHWPTQMPWFDENGMYRDPNQPMLYDLTTRCQIQIMMGQGYHGKYRDEIDKNLKKAGLYTLLMQSVSYQFPYGGRSNQFLLNEVLIAANCEYEANRYFAEGNLKLAGMFKRSAHLAVLSMKRWLFQTPPHHIKNFYPQDSLWGCEDYGYYDKYMATVGSFVYIAYLYADDRIEEFPCPAEMGGFVFETSESFHKIFANNGTYFLEFDTNPDPHYDCAGLGRIHKKEIPTELMLSVPITENPSYKIPQENKHALSLCTGWLDEKGNQVFLYDQKNLKHTLSEIRVNGTELSFTVIWSGNFCGCSAIKEHYCLTEEEVRISAELIDPVHQKIFFAVPLFCDNGKEKSQIVSAENGIGVVLGDNTYHVTSSGTFHIDPQLLYNRNGTYQTAYSSLDGISIEVCLSVTTGK